MTVAELIAALQAMPQDAPIALLWDGALRSKGEVCWLASSGAVAIGPRDEDVYYPRDRPAGWPEVGRVIAGDFVSADL